MRLFGTPVGQLTAQHIEVLVNEHVAESRRLDYKRDVPTTDGAKADLVSDVCSFANTDGGVLVFGIDERDADEKKTGQAQRIVGITGTADDAILRLTQALESKITPSIGRLLTFQALTLAENRTVLALGIAQSYSRPHREEHRGKYLLRNDGGKYEPDVAETRRMFLESESWVAEADAFVASRIAVLRGTKFREPAFAAVHVMPLGRLRHRMDTKMIYDRVASLPPGEGDGLRVRPNIHGVCGQSVVYNEPDKLVEHVQVFRFGGIEYASTRSIRSDLGEGPLIFGELLTRNVRDVVRNAVEALSGIFELDAPFSLSLSLMGAEGFVIFKGSNPTFNPFRVPAHDVRVPSVVFESGDLDASIRQLTDVLWEAVGDRHPYWPLDDK